jgi:hypothetical protein
MKYQQSCMHIHGFSPTPGLPTQLVAICTQSRTLRHKMLLPSNERSSPDGLPHLYGYFLALVRPGLVYLGQGSTGKRDRVELRKGLQNNGWRGFQ